MKQTEKRIISLLLSGLMLLSNLPLAALAEEVVEEEETVVVTGQPPVAGRSLARESTDRREETQTENYPVWVDGIQLTSDTEETAVSYDPESGVLTLKDAQLDSLVLKESMTLALEGSNTIEAVNEIALQADADLTITGDGSLVITSDHALAMEVKGLAQGETRRGLTVQGTVTLSVTSSAEETPVALTSPKGITLGEKTHVKISHSTSGESYALPGSGYEKVGEGSFGPAGESWSADGSGWEFVGKDHVHWAKTKTQHYKTCADPECPLAKNLKLDAGEHDTIANANCLSGATCSVCGEYGRKDEENHAQSAVYASNKDQHWKVYPCCNTEVADTRQAHEMAYTVNGNQIDYRCAVCQQGSSITIREQSGEDYYVYNGEPKEMVVENGIDGENLPVTYIDSGETTLPGPPTEAGMYTALVEYQDLEARAVFEIERKPLTDSMVTLSSDGAVYGQQAERPRVICADGVTHTVRYERDNQETKKPDEIDWSSVGIVKITVIGTGNYSGRVTKTYTIRQGKPTASMFRFDAPEDLTYNGEKKEASVTALVEDMGTFEVCYEADPVSAGTYRVRVQVTGDGDYEAELLEDDSWCFTIEPTDQYTDNTTTKQVIGAGTGEFQTPSFTGVGGEEVAGACVYTLDDGEPVANENALLTKLEGLENGATVTVGYTFTPSDGNYTGLKEGSVQVTKVALTFVTDDDKKVSVATVRAAEYVPYGTKSMIDVSKLKATLGTAVDTEDSHFTVEFTQDGRVVTTTGDLDVGDYGFTVYYSNPDLGGYAVEKVKVVSGWIHITRKTLTISDANKPKGGYIIQKQDGSAQPLLTEENAGQTDNDLKLEYSLNQYGSYSSRIPEAAEADAYTVWYRAPKSGNYDSVNAEGSVEVVIFPWLTATYGEMLGDIQLPDGFMLHYKNPEKNSVGNAGKQEVLLDYRQQSLTGTAVPLTVKPKEINVSFTIPEQYRYMLYNAETPAQAIVSEVRNETDNCVLPDNQYTLHYENENGRGEAKVWPVSNGNYAFTAEPLSYYIYDPVAATLTDNAQISNAVKNAGYSTGKAIREALEDKFPAEYPETRRKFTYFLMKTGDGVYDYAENGWPEKGLSMKIAYPDGTDRKDTFKVYAMYLVDYKDIKAGTIVEMKQATDTLGMGEYTCYEDRICLKMPTYMAVAIGAEAEKYTLKRTSSTRATITFTVGEDTTPLTTAQVRAGDTVTVSITDIQTKYGVSLVEYYETDLGYTSSDPVEVSQNADGTYSFEMPEYDATIKVTIRKSSGNPKTGDVIRFWVTLMTISGAGVAGLLIWRRKKRK